MKTQMRIALGVILSILIGAQPLYLASTAKNSTQSLLTGLVAHYTFDDGTATDKSGNSNDGVVYGATVTPGVVGNALHFTGLDTYVFIPHSPSLSLSDQFTISGWVKPSAPNRGFVPILTKGNTRNLFTPYAVVYYFDGSKFIPHIRFTSDEEVNVGINLQFDNALDLNNWNFFVWRYSHGVLEVFDGLTKLGEQDLEIDILASHTYPMEIGRDIYGSTEMLIGDLDDIRIYNRVISNEEIQLIYQHGFQPTGYLTSPPDGLTIGPVTLPLTAEIMDPGSIGVNNVEFMAYYDGSWNSAGIDNAAPYNAIWQTPNKLRSQQIRFGINLTDSAQNIIEFAGGYHSVNYLEYLGNPDLEENWIPTRAYLNQRSLTPDGDIKCSVASMAMVLAMNGLLSHEYITMRDKANEMYPFVLNTDGDANVDDMAEELERQGLMASAQYYSVNNAWNAIKAEIDQGRPVIVRTVHGAVTQYGHFFVAVGYREATPAPNRQLIIYDPFGRWLGTCCTNNYDINTREASSRKGQWVYYDFDSVFGGGNWLITGQPASNHLNHVTEVNNPTTMPDMFSDEPENIDTYLGNNSEVTYTIFLSVIVK